MTKLIKRLYHLLFEELTIVLNENSKGKVDVSKVFLLSNQIKFNLLKTEQQYNDACERIYRIINSTDDLIEPQSSKGEEIELLSFLVEKYEQEHWAIEAPTPVEAIKFRMEQMNLRQSDIAPLFGGKTRIP